ncbi:MAG: hypothetical protein ACI303_02505 [Lepagella sp.]
MVRARVSASGKSGKSVDNNKKESSLKNMRMFYDELSPVLESTDTSTSISPTMIGEIETASLLTPKSSATVDDFELFCNLSFTHHIRILNGEKDVAKR